MDRSDQYEREDAVLEQCVRPGDLDRMRAIVRRSVAELVGEARTTGRIDVVKGLARVTAVRVVGPTSGCRGTFFLPRIHALRWLADGRR